MCIQSISLVPSPLHARASMKGAGHETNNLLTTFYHTHHYQGLIKWEEGMHRAYALRHGIIQNRLVGDTKNRFRALRMEVEISFSVRNYREGWLAPRHRAQLPE